MSSSEKRPAICAMISAVFSAPTRRWPVVFFLTRRVEWMPVSHHYQSGRRSVPKLGRREAAPRRVASSRSKE